MIATLHNIMLVNFYEEISLIEVNWVQFVQEENDFLFVYRE